MQRQVQPAGVGPLKNRAAYRSIPIGAAVVDALAAHLPAVPGRRGPVHVPHACRGYVPPHVFNAAVWRPATVAAGVAGTGMHALRYAVRLAPDRGRPSVKVVSDRLGHTNAAMTLNVYSHLFPADEDRTRQAIDDAFRPKIHRTWRTYEADCARILT